MRLGYARVSTQEQILDLQLQALRGAGCETIYSEKLSGARPSRARPEFSRLLEHLRAGDVVVVWRLDRLARSTRDLLETIDRLGAAGVGFQSLSEPWADTTTPAGKLIMTVFAGIAEFERALIRERTAAGRALARERGVRFGRPRALTAQQAGLARRLLEEGQSARTVAKTFGVDASTIYRLSGAAPVV